MCVGKSVGVGQRRRDQDEDGGEGSAASIRPMRISKVSSPRVSGGERMSARLLAERPKRAAKRSQALSFFFSSRLGGEGEGRRGMTRGRRADCKG